VPGWACTEGLVAEMMYGSGPNYSNQTLYRHFGLPLAILLAQRKATRSCPHHMHVTKPGSGNKFHGLDFHKNFHSCALSEKVRIYTSQTLDRCLCAVPETLN
jgi:hypothetical protein